MRHSAIPATREAQSRCPPRADDQAALTTEGVDYSARGLGCVSRDAGKCHEEDDHRSRPDWALSPPGITAAIDSRYWLGGAIAYLLPGTLLIYFGRRARERAKSRPEPVNPPSAEGTGRPSSLASSHAESTPSSNRQIGIPVSSLRALWIGFVGLEAGKEAPDLAFDLVRRWSPRLFEHVARSIQKSEVRAFSSNTMENLLAAIKLPYEKLYPGCSLVIQHGSFAMMQRSTGKTADVSVVLATIFSSESAESTVVAGAGLDLALVPADEHAARFELREGIIPSTIPATHREKLTLVRQRLTELTITDAQSAEKEFDEHNESRRTVWGDRAAIIPISHGSADTVFASIVECIADDFRLRGANDLAVEEVPDLEINAFTATQLDSLSPGQRSKFERKLAAHREGGVAEPGRNIRKVVVSVYFPGSFDRHEILRTSEADYAAMPCTLIESRSVPARGRAGPRDQSRDAITRKFAKRSPKKKVLIGCISLIALSIVINVFVGVVSGVKTARQNIMADSLAQMYTARIGDDGTTATAARVKPGFFQTLNTPLIMGRAFMSEEDSGTAPPSLVISYDLWRDRFNRVADIVGTTVKVDGRPATIVGVTPSGFQVPRGAALWVPDKTTR